MADQGFSRRSFLQQATTVLAGFGIAAGWPQFAVAAQQAAAAMDADEVLRVLNPQQAADLGALADTIYPPTDTPGATQIGAVWFMDRAFDGFMAGPLPMITAELDAINQEIRNAGGEPVQLASLSQTERESLLKARVQTPFFSVLQLLTLAGVFAMPAYGGNRQHEGWRQIGFDHRHAWVPPFGHYDAEQDDAGAAL